MAGFSTSEKSTVKILTAKSLTTKFPKATKNQTAKSPALEKKLPLLYDTEHCVPLSFTPI